MAWICARCETQNAASITECEVCGLVATKASTVPPKPVTTSKPATPFETLFPESTSSHGECAYAERALAKVKKEASASLERKKREKAELRRRKNAESIKALKQFAVLALIAAGLYQAWKWSSENAPRNPTRLSNASGSSANRTIRRGWFVVLGTFSEKQLGPVRTQLKMVRPYSKTSFIANSSIYSGWVRNKLVVLDGPFLTKEAALSQRRKLKSVVHDAYVLKGE